MTRKYDNIPRIYSNRLLHSHWLGVQKKKKQHLLQKFQTDSLNTLIPLFIFS